MFDLSDIGEVIAERRLYVEGEPDRVVRVLLGKPVRRPTASNEDFSLCPYQIVGLGNETIRAAGGVDSIQALQLAMEMVGADLHLRYGGSLQAALGCWSR
jgi:hypothetical protein